MPVLRNPTLAALGLLALAAASRAQTTWYVDDSGAPPGTGTLTDPYTSIQYAIDRPTTVNGDTILVLPGWYVENVIFNGKRIVLQSTGGPQGTRIDGLGLESCVRIVNGEDATTVLDGFTLAAGNAVYGGGLRTLNSSPVVRNCVIRNNNASQRGGGIWVGFGSPRISRCVIANNNVSSAGGVGGGMYSMYGFTLSISHCTFFANGSVGTVGGYKSEFSTGASVENSIFFFNSGADVETYVSTIAFRYCDVEGGFAGTGNFSADPLVWNDIAFDWHLRPGSPCIDAGDPASPLDPDGSIADVGAYPFDPTHCGPPYTYCTGKTNSVGCLPAIASSGMPSATSPLPFLITASGVVNNKTGLLFYGAAANNAPFQGGILCATLPLKRTPAQNSGGNPPPNDCSGTFSIDFNARIQSGVDPGLVPGASVNAQWYYRDPPASFGVGLTNAVAFNVCP